MATDRDVIAAALPRLEALEVEARALRVELADHLEGPRPPDQAPLVETAEELRAALLQGGTIYLAPDHAFTGPFEVTVPGTQIVGRTDLPDGRVGPDDVARWALSHPGGFEPTLQVKASGFRALGLTVLAPRPDRETVLCGDHFARTAEAQPDGVTFDRVAVLAVPADMPGEGLQGGLRGFSVHTRGFSLLGSHVAGFIYRGRDAQAFFGNNGPGPYTLDDSYLEGSGENILFGGDDVRIPDCVPSDILVRRCTIRKPQEWRQNRGSVKNLFELKNARRVVVEDCELDGCWKDWQDGHPIVLTVRNQYGRTPWAIVDDVTLRRCTVRNARDGYAANILGLDDTIVDGRLVTSQQTRRLTIDRCYFPDARSGFMVAGGVTDALTITRCTLPSIRWNLTYFRRSRNHRVMTPFTFVENVAAQGEYGLNGESTLTGIPALEAWASPYEVARNVIERPPTGTHKWPAGVGNRLVDNGTLAGLLEADGCLIDRTAGHCVPE